MPKRLRCRRGRCGIFYDHKKLESRPANWESIISLIDDDLAGVVCKLTGKAFRLIVLADYEAVAVRLFTALGRVPHLVLVHDEVLTGKRAEDDDDEAGDEDWFDESWQEHLQRNYFHPPPHETREAVIALLERCGVEYCPYQTNAELSVLSAAFVADAEKNLLFRVYVPTGRLYAAEADRLLELFRDWLTQVKRQRVRQDGYTTGHGRVYEFFGERDEGSIALSSQFVDFSRFLELCVGDPPGAARELVAAGLDAVTAEGIVSRYGKESKRINRDLRQARETLMLGLTHRLESDLEDAFESPGQASVEIGSILDALVPPVSQVIGAITSESATGSPTIINFNQQIVQSVEGTVVQAVQGTVNLGTQAQELMALIAAWSGADKPSLESDVHELEDDDARMPDRLAARQRLKRFLLKLEGKVEDTVLGVLQRYVESKLGI